MPAFLDDDRRRHHTEVLRLPIHRPSELAHSQPDALLVACVASPYDPLRRLKLVARLGVAPERYATLAHPTAVIPESATIGRGSVLHTGTVLTPTCG